MTFVAPDGYIKIIGRMMETAETVLGEDLTQLISTPMVPFVTPEYWAAPVRIMILGQETLGRETPLAASEFSQGWLDRYVERERQEFAELNFAYGKWFEKRPFWTGYQHVIDGFGLPSRGSAYYSNASKVQLVEVIGGRFSIKTLSAAGQMKIINWQRELFQAEIRAVEPDIIFAMSGDLTGILRHLMATDQSQAGYVKPFDRVEGQSGDFGFYTNDVLGKALLFATYHPNARGMHERKMDHREKGIAYLKDWLSARNR